MAAEVEFNLLGPLEVRRGGAVLPLSAGRQRALLAALLLSPGRVLCTDELIEVLWEDRPPRSARASLHNYVKRLRTALADDAHRWISTYPQGYLIRVGPDELDVTRFEALLGAARAAARDGRWRTAAEQARAALRLWRGEPLADTGSQLLAQRAAPRLAELRLQALEAALDAELRLGQQAEVIGELRSLVAEQPLREGLHALLMLALYRDGRQGEALSVYQQARTVLSDELGTEPGPRLRELHQQILTADPSLITAQPKAPAAGGAAAATRTLPRDTASFTGRRDELTRLAAAAAAASAASTGGVVGIQAIGGMAGAGKTALAVHAAHLLAPRFPDGQLFVPLHGHTPGRRPVHPGDALASLLLAAGTPAAQIPPGPEERAGLWRDQLADRQVLLVLDDAASSEQVRPLLPGAGGSLVLVTSRRHLTALEDAEVISLDVLPAADAAALLVRLAGRPGLHPDDAATAEICALCGCLPLAIGMLARQLHHHPSWVPAGLAAELGVTHDRLDLLQTENASVAAAFDLSYAELTHDQQRLFRRLGLHPGSDIDAYAAAALDDTSLAVARHGLHGLYGQCLLTEPAAGRYRLHDLLREHAHTLATHEDPAADRDHALDRLLDYYTHTANLAEGLLARQTKPSSRSAPAVPPAAVPLLADSAAALDWARAERANLLASLDWVTETGQHGRVVALTAAIASLLRLDGPWADAAARHLTAARAARQCGDRLGQANALSDLGLARRMTGDLDGSAQALEEALDISRAIGDRLCQAKALSDLGILRSQRDHIGAAETARQALGIYRDLGDRLGQANSLLAVGLEREMTGDYNGAAQAEEESLRLYRDLGNRLGQVNALTALGCVRRLTGDYAGASQMLEEALGICRGLGHRLGQANALNYLGIVRRLTGDYPGAVQVLEEALSLHRDLGDRLGAGHAVKNLGIVRRLTGDYRGAAQAQDEAARIFHEISNWSGRAEALNERGILHRIGGDLERAQACHRQALEMARSADAVWDEAHALAGLGRCALAAGHPADARVSLQQAHEMFRQMGSPETAGVAIELDALAWQPGLAASQLRVFDGHRS